MIDHNKLNTIGYDRMVFNIGIQNIDTAKMGHLKSGISYAGAGDHIYLEIEDLATKSAKKVKNLNMVTTSAGAVRTTALEKDGVKYGLKVKPNSNNLTGGIFMAEQLDLVAGRVAYNTTHNVYNLHNSEMLLETLNRIKQELEIYGIYLNDPETWVVYSAEVNKTIAAEYPLEHYDRALQWMFNELFHSDRYLEKHNIERKLRDSSITHTYKCNARGESVKVYDKSGQIRDTLNTIVPENLIRLEFTWNRERLKRIFKSEDVTVKDLQQMDLLEQAFNKALDEIIKILQDAAARDIKEIEKSFRKTGYKELERVLRGHLDIFDIILLYRAGLSYHIKENNKHFSEHIKKLHTDIQEIKKHNYKDLMYLLAAFRGCDVNFFKLTRALKKYL